jgi:hypothetical protein
LLHFPSGKGAPKAVSDLLPRLPWYQKLNIKLMKKEGTISLHHRLGTGLRNRYGPWRGNCFFRYPCHPDYASAKTIEAGTSFIDSAEVVTPPPPDPKLLAVQAGTQTDQAAATHHISLTSTRPANSRWFHMPGFSLVPVDYQPDFEDVSLVPVDHDPFSADGVSQQAQAQPAQTQSQSTQPQPETAPQQPATGDGRPNVGTPANGDGPGESEGGSGIGPAGGDAGSVPGRTLDQGGSEAGPFSGYANPTPTESLINGRKMDDQAKLTGADPTGMSGAITDGGELYKFVTTGPTRRYLIDGGTGVMIVATSPFYAFDGTRYAIIDASVERPVTVRVPEDGKFTVSRP